LPAGSIGHCSVGPTTEREEERVGGGGRYGREGGGDVGGQELAGEAPKGFRRGDCPYKKLQQLTEKTGALNGAQQVRRRLCAQPNRTNVEISRANQKIPFHPQKWKEFSREIEPTMEKLSHLHSAAKNLEACVDAGQRADRREVRRAICNQEALAGLQLPVPAFTKGLWRTPSRA
jgi:hypothetical protein